MWFPSGYRLFAVDLVAVVKIPVFAVSPERALETARDAAGEYFPETATPTNPVELYGKPLPEGWGPQDGVWIAPERFVTPGPYGTYLALFGDDLEATIKQCRASEAYWRKRKRVTGTEPVMPWGQEDEVE